MNKRLLTLLTILGFGAMTAQDLYVANNSYVFVTNEVIYVEDDIRLDTNTSNIYLRNLAQLVQGSDTKNSDEGDLSVLQDQTVGVHEYNYWASPVGLSDTSTNTNTNADTGNLFYDTGLVTSTAYTANAPSLAFLEGTASELSTYWFYTLETGNGYADWVQAGNTAGAIRPGYGFTMKGNGGAGNDYDFRGRPNNGNITINIDNSGPLGYSETLSGNPYPSALDVKLFLIDIANVALDGNTYYWQQQAVGSHFISDYQGGYAVYAPGNPVDLNDHGTYTVATFIDYDENGNPDLGTYGTSAAFSAQSTRFAPIGQGFMLRGALNGTATFTNSMRVYLPEGANSIFRFQDNDNSRTSNETDENSSVLDTGLTNIPMSHNGLDYESMVTTPTLVPELKIHTKINDTYIRENIIAFRNGSTTAFDKFMDGKHPLFLAADVYMPTQDNNLVIQSITFDEDEKVPFAFYVTEDAGQTNFSVALNKIVNYNQELDVYVHDKELNTYTDIKNGNFNITLTPGDYNNRFEIVFKHALQDQVDDVNDNVVSTFDIFQDNNNSVLTIKNPELIDIDQVAVFDVSGKLVFNKTDLQTQEFYSFPSNNLSDGIYIVKLMTADNVDISKKVSVYNRK